MVSALGPWYYHCTSGCQLKKKKNADCFAVFHSFLAHGIIFLSYSFPATSLSLPLTCFLHTHKPYLLLFLCRTYRSLSLVLCSLSLSRASLPLIYFFCDVFGFVIFKTRSVCFRKSNPSTHHSTEILGLLALCRY
jgi:hypothetical protein